MCDLMFFYHIILLNKIGDWLNVFPHSASYLYLCNELNEKDVNYGEKFESYSDCHCNNDCSIVFNL